MNIKDIDYLAVFGDSKLHKIKALYKFIFIALILFLALSFKSVYFAISLYFIVFFINIINGFQVKKIFLLSFFPILFLVVYFLSIENLTVNYFLMTVFRVLSLSTSFSLLIFTTDYSKILKTLKIFMPDFLAKTLFLTYRSIFILLDVAENIKTTMHLRGRLQIKRPFYSLSIVGNFLGLFIVRVSDLSEKTAESLSLRGF